MLFDIDEASDTMIDFAMEIIPGIVDIAVSTCTTNPVCGALSGAAVSVGLEKIKAFFQRKHDQKNDSLLSIIESRLPDHFTSSQKELIVVATEIFTNHLESFPDIIQNRQIKGDTFDCRKQASEWVADYVGQDPELEAISPVLTLILAELISNFLHHLLQDKDFSLKFTNYVTGTLDSHQNRIENLERKQQNLQDQMIGMKEEVISSLSVDTEQIQSVAEYVKWYNARALAADLNTSFQFRDMEIQQLDRDFDQKDVVILSGVAGAGKTRLALHFAQLHAKKNKERVYCIHDRGLPIFENLRKFFSKPGSYFIVVDDANHLSQLHYLLDYVNKRDDGYHVKLLITVRSYALQEICDTLSESVDYGKVELDTLSCIFRSNGARISLRAV